MMMKKRRFVILSASAIVALTLIGLSIPIIQARRTSLKLAPTSGSLTPGASGELSFSLSGGVLSGKAETEDLPPQGSHLAYVLWFVNTVTGDKAFLGPLIQDDKGTILFQSAGDGAVAFRASEFTAGPHAGSPITFASTGNNLFIILVENKIDFANPSPIGTALSATF
jgi:hypothetical protein